MYLVREIRVTNTSSMLIYQGTYVLYCKFDQATNGWGYLDHIIIIFLNGQGIQISIKICIYTNRLRPLTAFIRGAIFPPGDVK